MMANPLTKRTKEGALLVRPPEVETNIDGTLDQDTTELIRRAVVTDPASFDYLTSECLVHTIRTAIRRGDDSRYNRLLPFLLLRCEANLKSTIRPSVPNAELIRQEVLSAFGVLFASEVESEPPNALDFYECRFDRAFRTLRLGVLRRELKSIEGAEVLSDGSETEDGHGRPANLPECRPVQEDDIHLADLHSLLDKLPPELQRVVAFKQMGYVASSDDSKKVTIATLCGVSGRTVGARLKQAHKLMQQMRPEKS